MALGALSVIPLQIAGVALNSKLNQGVITFSTKEMKEPNLLLGDAIMNFRTVQSFGYENLVVDLYLEMQAPIDALTFKMECYKSVFMGFVNMLNFLTNALLFLIAGAVFENMKQF